MTITNGASHQSVDDILATIRSTNGEQNLSPRLNPANPIANANAANPHTIGELHPNAPKSFVVRDLFSAEASDFELPAIFKPGHQFAPEKPNLLGRITDALKPAVAEQERPRTVIRFEQAAANRMLEPPRAATPAPGQLPMQAPPSSHPRSDQPRLNPVQRTPEPAALQQVKNDQANVKREVPSFFDTRMSRMADMSRPAAPPTQALTSQPLSPALIDHGNEFPGMDDAAAQLLRPILKQWLSENMPKIVEKALRSESADDQPGGDNPAAPPRKTLR